MVHIEAGEQTAGEAAALRDFISKVQRLEEVADLQGHGELAYLFERACAGAELLVRFQLGSNQRGQSAQAENRL